MEIINILGFLFFRIKGLILAIGEVRIIYFNDKEITYERDLIIKDLQNGEVIVTLTGDYVDIKRKGEIILEGGKIEVEVEKTNKGNFIVKTIY